MKKRFFVAKETSIHIAKLAYISIYDPFSDMGNQFSLMLQWTLQWTLQWEQVFELIMSNQKSKAARKIMFDKVKLLKNHAVIDCFFGYVLQINKVLEKQNVAILRYC